MSELLRHQYLASFEDKITRIEQALAGNDRPVLIQLIHQLAGSSGSYGLTRMAELCAGIEAQLLTGDEQSSADCETMIRPLLIEMNRLNAEHKAQP